MQFDRAYCDGETGAGDAGAKRRVEAAVCVAGRVAGDGIPLYQSHGEAALGKPESAGAAKHPAADNDGVGQAEVPHCTPRSTRSPAW